MSARVSPVAAIGSLFKGAVPARKPKEKRERAPDYLTLVRRCPCLSCDQDPSGEAAHLRMSAAGKPVTGTGIKPGDQWALPLCKDCHTIRNDSQHAVGERAFWRGLGLDPMEICVELYMSRGSIERMRTVCMAAREKRL